MTRDMAITFAMVQATELSYGRGKGYTEAGLQRLYDHQEPAERAAGEKLVRLFNEELEKRGFAVLPKELRSEATPNAPAVSVAEHQEGSRG
jgi:hypothetical protein